MISQHLLVTLPKSNRVVGTDAAIYRENLNAYCLKKGWVSRKNPLRGSPGELVARLGKTSSYWSDLLSGQKSFSSDLARQIEAGLGMPKYGLAGDAKAESMPIPVAREPAQLHSINGGVRGALQILANHVMPLNREMRSAVLGPLSALVNDPGNAAIYIESLAPLLGEIGSNQESTNIKTG